MMNLLYLAGNITEYNNPQEQLVRVKELIEHIKNEELPATREEFESSALLFHIFMDIEDFLLYKNILLIILIRHRKSTTGKQVRRRKAL